MKEKHLPVKRVLNKVKLRCLQCYCEPFKINRVAIVEYSDLSKLLESPTLLVVYQKTRSKKTLLIYVPGKCLERKHLEVAFMFTCIKSQPGVVPLHPQAANNLKIFRLLVYVDYLIDLYTDLNSIWHFWHRSLQRCVEPLFRLRDGRSIPTCQQ